MLFPDIDRDFLVSEIEKEMQRNKGNQELAAAAVANDLLSRSNTNSIPKCSSRQALTTGQGGRHDGQDETAVNNTLDGGNNNDSTTSSLSGLFNQFTDSIKRTGWGGALLGAGGESGGFSGGGGGGGTSSSIGGDPSSSEVTPQYTKSVQQHLKQSLSSLSSVRQDSFTASIPSDPPVIPTTQASARCSLLAESDLTFITSISGIKVFIEKQATLADIQMVTNGIATRRYERESYSDCDGSSYFMLGSDILFLYLLLFFFRFIKVIRLLAQVFEVSPHVFHIYWDVASPTVAFNRNRAVFFNLRFYMGLHSHPGGRSSPPPPPLPGGFGGGGASSSTINTTSIGGDEDMLQLQKNDDSDVYYYWFLTACHELAHNFVSPHNAEHEFYMSSFAENYLKKMVSALKQQGISPT